jgi:DNA primase
MLRASTLAAKRKLELRVVPLPAGRDPAELIHEQGPAAMTAAVASSTPFVRFRVERVLAGGDDTSPEGRDRMVEQLRPVFAQLGPGAMYDELVRLASSRLAVSPGVFETALGASGGAGAAQAARGGPQATAARADDGEQPGGAATRRAPRALSGREEAERAFLALCIAAPEDGEAALAGLSVEEHFSNALTRRAAHRLREGWLREPLGGFDDASGGTAGDGELERLLAELVVQAGGERAEPAMLEVQRLQLELARIDRQIQRARGEQGGAVSELAGQRAEVKREFDRAYGRVLEATGAREE